MRIELKAYEAYVKEVHKWVNTEFAFASADEKLVIFERALRPISYWDNSNAVQIGAKEIQTEHPISLLEKYPDYVERITDKRLKKLFIKDTRDFVRLMEDARKEGWEYNDATREFVRA